MSQDSPKSLESLQNDILALVESLEKGPPRPASSFPADPPAVTGPSLDELFGAMSSPPPVRFNEGEVVPGGGLLGAMDMNDVLRDVYLILMRAEPMTLDQMRESALFAEVEDRDLLPIYVRTLMRQGYLEREKTEAGVTYSAVVGERKGRVVNTDIWDLLDG